MVIKVKRNDSTSIWSIGPILGISDIKIKTSLDDLTETAELSINKKYLYGSGGDNIILQYEIGSLLANNSSDGLNIGSVPNKYYCWIYLNDVIDINMGNVDITTLENNELPDIR